MYDVGEKKKSKKNPSHRGPPAVCFSKPEERRGKKWGGWGVRTFPLWLTFNLRCCIHSPWASCFFWLPACCLFDLAASPALLDSHIALRALAGDLSGNEKLSPGKDRLTECFCQAVWGKDCPIKAGHFSCIIIIIVIIINLSAGLKGSLDDEY